MFVDGHSGAFDADIDAPEAWASTRGSATITVAVIDQGVTSDHPDLPNSRQLRLNGSNFAAGLDGTSADDPSPTGNGNHGNSCAGLVAATHGNNQGIAGVAPNVRVMPIRIPVGMNGATPQNFADAINFARQNGADVISNSWGYNSTDQNLFPVIVTAIQNATTQGRVGSRGCVVVFAAGNTANHVVGNAGVVLFPAGVNVAGGL